MRSLTLAVVVLSMAVSGCGKLRTLTTKSDLPKPADPLEQTNVDDTFRGTSHALRSGD